MTVETEAEARILEAEITAKLLAGRPVGPIAKGHVPTTLGALAQRTYDRVWAGSRAEKSAWINACSAVNFFGSNIPINGITPHIIDNFVEDLEGKGLSNATINRKLAALSKMLHFAQSRGWLERVPRIDRKREGPGRTRFLSIAEEARLLQTLRQWGNENYHDLVVVLIDTGMRVGEALRLEDRDLDFTTAHTGRPLIRIWQPKNGEPRSVPMTRRVELILRARSGDRPFGDLTQWALRHVWDRAKTHLEFSSDRQFVPHCLRHTCASRLVQGGVPLPVVQAWLGHKTIQMTMRYAHLTPQNLMDAARVLEDDAPWAGVAELVDARGLKPRSRVRECGFDSRRPHHHSASAAARRICDILPG